jgi:hypothetical protein
MECTTVSAGRTAGSVRTRIEGAQDIVDKAIDIVRDAGGALGAGFRGDGRAHGSSPLANYQLGDGRNRSLSFLYA